MKFKNLSLDTKEPILNKITLNGESRSIIGYPADSITLQYPYLTNNAFFVFVTYGNETVSCQYKSDDASSFNAMLTSVSTALIAVKQGAAVLVGIDSNTKNLVDIYINGIK